MTRQDGLQNQIQKKCNNNRNEITSFIGRQRYMVNQEDTAVCRYYKTIDWTHSHYHELFIYNQLYDWLNDWLIVV
jgi:hypothetical protein